MGIRRHYEFTIELVNKNIDFVSLEEEIQKLGNNVLQQPKGEKVVTKRRLKQKIERVAGGTHKETTLVREAVESSKLKEEYNVHLVTEEMLSRVNTVQQTQKIALF